MVDVGGGSLSMNRIVGSIAFKENTRASGALEYVLFSIIRMIFSWIKNHPDLLELDLSYFHSRKRSPGSFE